MSENRRYRDRSWKYVVTAYVAFTVMVMGICGTASMVFHASPVVMRILANVCAWSPTIVLFALFHIWCPDRTIGEFLRNAFSGKIKASLLLVSILSTGLTFLIGAAVYVAVNQSTFSSVFQMAPYPVAATILLSISAGPTGEECGWRGYLRPAFQLRYGFLKGNLLVGLVWTFWHSVLWIVDNEFTSGTNLLLYILSHIVVITAIHMIMAVVLERQDNLLYAILIHLFFNLPYCFLKADIRFYMIIMVLYTIEAIGFLGYRKYKKS